MSGGFVAAEESVGAEPQGPSVVRLVRRVGWGVADQGISSLANFVLGVVLARTLGARDFGAFTLAFVTFSFVLSAVRGPTTDPLMVRFSGQSGPEWRRAVAAASGTSVAAGALAGLACVVVGLVLPWELGSGFVALGVFLPAIQLQDSYRFAFFSRGQAHRAFLNDLVWCALQVIGVGCLVAAHAVTPWSAMLVFGGTGAVAAFCGYVQLRVAPAPRQTFTWLVDHKSLGTRYLLENTSVAAARYIRISAVGLVAGLAAVGDIRAAEMMMGPFMILLAGASQVAVPEARHVLLLGAERLYAFVAYFSGAQALLAGLWGAVALVALPRGLGKVLLGDIWPATEPLLLPVVICLGLTCFQTSTIAAIRALGASRRSLAAQLFSAAAYVVFGVGGAVVDGARGSCWGLAFAIVLGLVMWVRQLRKAVGEHLQPASSEVAP
jgi:O-antigen/teichoic acid export membrane protein